MTLVVTFRVPVAAASVLISNFGTPAADDAHIKAEIRRALISAMDKTLSPSENITPRNTPSVRVNLSLPLPYSDRVYALSEETGKSKADVCQGLVLALLESGGGTDGSHHLEAQGALNEILESDPSLKRRSEQIQFHANLREALMGQFISLTEAGTGTGKTLGILCAAVDILRSDHTTRIGIAVPTIALMRQFASVYARYVEQGVFTFPLRCIVGRREFISVPELKEIASKAEFIELRDQIEEWIACGGKALDDSAIQQRWLVHTLKEVAPTFPAEACALPDLPDADDPGYIAYRQQFDRDDYPLQEIIVCTHAMLAISTRIRLFAATRNEQYGRRQGEISDLVETIQAAKQKIGESGEGKEEVKKLVGLLNEAKSQKAEFMAKVSQNDGFLPALSHLIVDEGHMLESAMSAANSNYVSLRSLLSLLDEANRAGIGISKDKLTRARQAITGIKGLSHQDDIHLGGEDKCSIQAIHLLRELLDACTLGRVSAKGLSTEAKKEANSVTARLSYARAVIQRASSGSSMRSILRFSPIREYPQVLTGATSVSTFLSTLWASVTAASVVSATLYLKTKDSYSCAYIRTVLSIPEGRALEQTPVIPPWLFSTVKGVWLPYNCGTERNGHTWLRPPTRSDRLSTDAHRAAHSVWLEDVAQAIEQVYASAQGGVLVLMTSYDSTRTIAKLLPQHLQRDMIVATKDQSTTSQATGFLRLSHAGRKPLWLATGAAWTGLDVGGHTPWKALFGTELQADQDNVMTDLVIPRLPYGLNKSLTHEYRMESQPGVPWEILDTMFRFRQGLGRPVRREGLEPNRRFFMLDSRINEPKFRGMKAYITSILTPYRQLEPDTLKVEPSA